MPPAPHLVIVVRDSDSTRDVMREVAKAIGHNGEPQDVAIDVTAWWRDPLLGGMVAWNHEIHIEDSFGPETFDFHAQAVQDRCPLELVGGRLLLWCSCWCETCD